MIGTRQWLKAGRRIRRQGNRRPLLTTFLAGGAGLLVLALLAGLCTWLIEDGGGDARPRSAVNQAPFEAAIATLASAPEARYQSTVAGMGTVDVRVTSSGAMVGSVTDDGHLFQLLRAGGRLYLKPPASGLPDTTNSAETAAVSGKWLTGHLVDDLLGSLPSRFVPPQRLASVLTGGFGPSQSFVSPPVNGVPVLAAETRFGVLYVAQNRPYRIVRLAPASRPAPTTHPAVFTPVLPSKSPTRPTVAVHRASYRHSLPNAPPSGPGSEIETSTDTAGMDFPAEQPADVRNTDSQLQSDIRELSTAIDSDLNFNLQGKGSLQCGDAGCVVTVTVTNTAGTSSSGTRITGGKVTANLTASITIGGEPAGNCSNVGPLPLNGAGDISCSDLGAAGVYASVAAAKKAAAEEQSVAEGGVPVPYYIDWAGEYYVYATAQVDVEKLVEEEEGRGAAENAVKIYKAPQRGMTKKLLDEGFLPEDFPGDQKINSFPDGKAYFGLQDQGREIALDYASRAGGYDPNVIEIRIPAQDFVRYFESYVGSYDGIPAAEVAIPNTDFNILNRYPRNLVQ